MEPYLKVAFAINDELKDSVHLRIFHYMASKVYAHKKDYAKAYEHVVQYYELQQRLYNNQNNAVVNEMLAKYQANVKEKENQVLQRENKLLQQESELAAKTLQQERNKVYFIIVGVLLCMMLIFFIVRSLQLQRDNFSLKVKEQEVQLVKLNEMKTQADLKTLQARINPHFLYNALNSITSLIHERPDEAEDMTIKLSRLFRYSINTQESNWSSVKEEVNIVETYLDIERVRFGNRINFLIETDDSLQNVMIPRFLLQPLVENALKHGLKNIQSNGMLTVKVTDKDPVIELCVHDNGIPFPNQMMAGYGLQSINDKLNLLCGAAWKMRFINEGEKRICIELPKYQKQ
jgi:sensor histidine kinase YesM